MTADLIRALRFVRRYLPFALGAILAVLAASAADLVAPQLLRRIIDVGITQSRSDVILTSSLMLVGIAVLGGIATFLKSFLSAKASHGAAFDMRNEIFDKLQNLSFSYHDRAQTGQLITRVTSDVDLVRDFVGGGLVQAISAAIMLVGAVVLLVLMNWRLALVALLSIPATVLVLVRFVGNLGPTFRAFQQRLAALNSVLQENIAGVRVVKVFTREAFEAQRYRAADELLLEQGFIVRRTVANAFPLMFSVGTLGVALVTWVGAAQVVHGQLTVGELVAFTSYLGLLLSPLYVIGFGAQSIARAGASAQRLFEVLDAPIEVAQLPDATPLPRISGSVEFAHVTMRYPGADSDTLHDVSFAVRPGTSVAIVGATGSGKTSIVNLVPRFYDATGGVVSIDGHDVRKVTLGSLRSQVGVVMQDSVLFSGTIADNIAYGMPSATPEQVRAAAVAAEAHEFITRLPDGYQTRVGERGIKLSGGQRQRVAIARAVLIDPRILIMDDSTSSLDATTDAALRQQLDRLMPGRTTFIVAQRLSTVRKADTILLIDDGRLMAQGTHEELIANDCLYAEIVASQFAGSESSSVPANCELPADGDE